MNKKVIALIIAILVIALGVLGYFIINSNNSNKENNQNTSSNNNLSSSRIGENNTEKVNNNNSINNNTQSQNETKKEDTIVNVNRKMYNFDKTLMYNFD